MLYAKTSRLEIPTHGIFKLSEKALQDETPILIPVKEPGPTSETSKSILFKLNEHSFNNCWIKGINVSECVRPLSNSNFFIKFVSSKIATLHNLLEVSTAKIFKIILLSNFQ